MMYSIAYACYSWTTTPSSIYIDVPFPIRLYETAVADLTVLIHGIVAFGQCNLIEVAPASTVLTYTSIQTPLDNYARSDKDCHWSIGKSQWII
jgi:hypothetical protein